MPRPLREILAQPQTAAEQEIADRHIRTEAARIRATWSDEEFRMRAGFERIAKPLRVCEVVDSFGEFCDGDGDGDD